MLKILAAAMTGIAGLGIAAHAADLSKVYQLAKQNDPTLQKAAATREATKENAPLARSALLPQLSAGANYSRSKGNGSQSFYDSSTGAFVTPQTTSDTTSKGYSVTLNQSIFNWQDWLSLGQADLQAAQAEVNFHIAEQDLIVRLSQAYFKVLSAKDTLRAARANQKALAKQLQQAKKKYQVGMSAITDVQEVKAAYDQGNATVIADRQALINARDALIAITGVHVGNLAEPIAKLPLKKPQPANANAWIRQAIEQNLNLVSSRMAAKIAAKAVDIQQAKRVPTLGLQLSHNYSSSDQNGTLNGASRPRGSQSTGNMLRLQFSLPIYSGGAIAARSSQAKYQHVKAEAQTHFVARQVKQNTRDAFLGVLTGISKVKALKEAVVSAKTALKATIAGRKVGTRTTVDVLNARQKLLTARTNYAQARYQYLIDGLLLEQAAGTLNARDVTSINQYLSSRPTGESENPEPINQKESEKQAGS